MLERWRRARRGWPTYIYIHVAYSPATPRQTRMQILSSPSQVQYSSVLNALTRITSVEGARTLWRGVNSVILGAGPAHALYFGTYEVIKDLTGGNRQGHQWASTAFAGGSATIASDAFMNPFDVIKQRMQMENSTHRSVLKCARTLYQTEGLRAFYISYPTTLTMTVPFTAVQFSVYEWAKKVLNPSESYSPMTHVIAGGFSGGVAAAVTNPLDVAKTLLQTRGNSSDAEIRGASGMIEALKVIKNREGMKGFARGLTPRVLTFMPSNALCWLVSR